MGDAALTSPPLLYRNSIASATIWRWSSSSPLKPAPEERPSVLPRSLRLTLGCCLLPARVLSSYSASVPVEFDSFSIKKFFFKKKKKLRL